MTTQSNGPQASASYHNFTALALRSIDSVWHIAAALVDDGSVVDQLLVKNLRSVKKDLLKWTEDRPVVVHRKTQLDECDLGEKLVTSVLASTDPLCLDSHQLARIVLPRLSDHNLATLAACLGVDDSNPDMNPAVCVGECFIRLQNVLFTLELDSIRSLTRLSRGTESPLHDLFLEAEQNLLKTALSRDKHHSFPSELFTPSVNVEGTAMIGEDLWQGNVVDETVDGKSMQMLDPDEMVGIFSEGGAIDQAMDRFEHRPQQLSMVRAVTNTINDGEFLMVEAGTGTGKSLSYLVPTIYWALKNDQRVIISTNTKNLQEQLFFKDIPFLMKTLQAEFRVTLLKGRSNYLCPDRWRQVLDQPDDHLSLREKEEALPLVVWRSETATGDVSENPGFIIQSNRSLWNKINGEGGTCPKCVFKDDCFVTRARAAAAVSHLVIINHALLFSDLAADNVVLSEYAHLIVDEAHNLEKVAVQHMTVEVSVWRTRNMLRKLYIRESIEFGLLATLKYRADRSPMKQIWKDQLAKAVSRSIEAVTILDQANDAFFRDVTAQALKLVPPTAGIYAKLRYSAEHALVDFMNGRSAEFFRRFIHLRDTLGGLGEVLNDIPESWLADRDEFLNTILSCLESCKEIEMDLGALLKADAENTVYWVEASERSESSCVLIAAPLNVSERLHEDLFSNMRSAVFTSATMTVGTQFSYAARRLGLDRQDKGRLKTFRIGSPFNYQDQALVCVPSDFPKPRHEAFQPAVSEMIQSLVFSTRRSTLVLFTAYGMLNQVYADLEHPFNRLGIPLLAQGISGSRTSILDRFRSSPGSVLLGTDSFWEGIDVPGEALEIVILVKLPFAVPSEPMIEAQIEHLDGAGRNSFMEFLVPEAVIKFRQGVGRLIRSGSDRGAVVILDQRVIGTRYGQLFLDSLPTRHKVFGNAEALVDGVTGWFE